MNFTQFAFGKKQVTLLTIMIACLAGLIAYTTMPRDENPLYTVRKAQILTYWPGASPSRIEQLVSDKIEKKIQEIPEVDYIESESKTGVSVITVTILDRYSHMRPIWDELRRKVEDAEAELPETAQKPIVNDEYGDIYGIVFGIIGDGFTYAEIKDVADDVRDEILELPDVAKVDILGAQDERIFLDFNSDKLRELKLSQDQLQEILKARNIIQSGGIINGPHQKIAVEPTGNYQTVRDIKETLITIPETEQIVSLDTIANIYRGYIEPPKSIMHTSGTQSLGLAISMRIGGNILTLGQEISKELDSMLQYYPIGIQFEMIAYQPKRVTKKISEFVSNLVQAVVIVCAVMFLFLGLRTGFIVASLIPVVILITFFIMSLMNIGLNQITLASLIIALGMLVDNAIVMSESIIVQIKEGKKGVEAAINSAKELRVPLLISSLTTAAAFLPFYLAESGTGEYVGSLFLVVSTTLLCSWFIALTMIPIFCAYMLKVKDKKQKNPYENTFYKLYRKLLLGMLKARYLTLASVTGAFILAIYGLNWVPKIFYPPSDTPMFTAEIELPVDSSIYYTEKTINEIEKYIEKNLLSEGVINWAAYIGNGGPRFRLQHDPEPPNTYYAFLLFNVTDYQSIQPIIQNLETYIFETYPDVKAKIRPLEEGTPVSNPVEIRISGKDEQTLFTLADSVKAQLSAIPGTRDIDDDWGLEGKKIVILVDQIRAKRAGITNSDIALSLESAFSGVTVSEFREEDELIPMILRSEVAKDVNLIGKEAFNIYSQATGESVPLEQVASIDMEWEPTIIFRRNRLKTLTVFSNVLPSYTASEIDNQIIPWLEQESAKWPPGYRFAIGGEEEQAGKAQDSIFVKLPIAALLILFLLMLQFNSLKRTSIILVTIPLSIIGVVLGLLITDSYFGIMTILGIISLAGIVINNAIVLLDRIKLEIEENNLSPQKAVIVAAQKRFRPITLTTITTTASLIPLWMGGGPLWEPMTIALIFGLVIATILTLGIVPVLYSFLFKVSYKGWKFDTESP